jgi:hypothetical protein
MRPTPPRAHNSANIGSSAGGRLFGAEKTEVFKEARRQAFARA